MPSPAIGAALIAARPTVCFRREELPVGNRPVADIGRQWLCKPMADAILTLEQMDTDVTFFHRADERAFFEWLERIPCVESVKGQGRRGLVVRLKRRPGQDDLRQLLALAHRYGLEMSKFAKFETEANRDWFRDPEMFWHNRVFGGTLSAS